jgi:amino acid transporter
VLLTALLGLLLVINLRGVRGGARLSNFFMLGKLVPIALFILAGLALVGSKLPAPRFDAGLGDWMTALLALVFAYGGFEAALIPMAEARRPRQDTPFALYVALASCALIYTAIHLVVMSALADPATSARPVADAAQVFLGRGGAALIAAGAMISMFGYLGGQFVSAPRLPYALARGGDFPARLGAVHPRFRTPYLAILVYGLAVWGLALYGSFLWNAILSAVARLFTYALVCGALPVLRRRNPAADAYRLPGGWLLSGLGILFSAALITRMGWQELAIIAFTSAIALANWLWIRRAHT